MPRLRFSRAESGAGLSFFLRALRVARWMRRRLRALEGSVGFRWRGRFLIFSLYMRVVDVGEWARERRDVETFEGMEGLDIVVW